MAERYQYDFSWHSPYGRVVELMREQAAPGGVVLDLGCGSGAVAEPLAELGFTYVGCDISSCALQDVRERGFETHRIDLSDVEGLPERLVKIADGREVRAILMLDALEHLPDPEAFLAALRACCLELDRPLLGLSVPNVAHFDVGAKLAAGMWDVTPAGLLDRTHLQFFTERRLVDMLRAGGWAEVSRKDFRLHHSDQHFPPHHPVLADGAPLRDLLWRLRAAVDDDMSVNQFVRLFALVSAQPPRPPVERPAGPFLSVLVRTVGRRMANLTEALTCLAAQTDDDLEVILLVHSSLASVVEEVRGLVNTFAPTFRVKVQVHQVPDGGRARPLNVGLEAARGRYVAFLDDDDLVTADWAERFRAGAASAPGRVVRSVTADRWVRRNDDERLRAPYLTLSGLEMAHSHQFDFLEHLSRNRTPICSFAVPTDGLRALGVRFDENTSVLEDWYFLLQVAIPCGVHDTGRITSVYHRWQGSESSLALVDRSVWDITRAAILQRLDTGPLLLPAGSASTLAEMWERMLGADDRLSAAEEAYRSAAGEADRLRAALATKDHDLEEARRSAEQEARASAEARAVVKEVLTSTTWRASLPLRWTVGRVKDLRSRKRRAR